jgi:dihydroneopterin aldolase
MDEIMLRGLVFFGRHGVNPEEAELGQRFGVDLTVRLDLSEASRTDRLEDTVSYSALWKLVRDQVEGSPSLLLEHLAGRLLDAVLAHDTRIQGADVTVVKLHPPLRGITAGDVAVRMSRSRAG